MASLYVRQMVRDWLNMGNVKHYDTTNFEVNPEDKIWVTAEWTYANAITKDYCGGVLEEGTLTIVFFGMPGIGDDELLGVAEEEMEALMSRVDSSGRLVLLKNNPADDYRQGEFYVAQFLVNYEFSK